MDKDERIKLFAIDLDGTLYDEKKRISELSRKMINKAMNSGIQPIIATGRGPEGAELALDLLRMDLPYICNAGAMIKSGRNGEIIYANSFHHRADLIKMIKFARETNTALLVEPLAGGIIYFGSATSLDIMDDQSKREIAKGKQTTDPESDFDVPLLKFTLVAPKALMDAFRQMVEQECSPYNMVESGLQFLDLTADDTNKGTALEYYAKYLGIHRAQTASIGDQEIDITMLNFSHVKFAMGNAVEPVKRVAQIVVPTNNEHGVVRAIEHLLERNNADIFQ